MLMIMWHLWVVCSQQINLYFVENIFNPYIASEVMLPLQKMEHSTHFFPYSF